MLEFQDGIRMSWQASTTHTSLHKTNTRWLVHNWNIFGARTSHEQFGLTRLTTTWTWGKPPPSPFYYTLRLSTGATSKWFFVLGFPSGNPEIPTTRISATLGAHNFVCKPLITMRYETNLYSSSKTLQRYVAHCLLTRKLGQFPTFSGQESNYQFDSWPFFWS
jgi:hypothetical protein